jgi:hypothetical protein
VKWANQKEVEGLVSFHQVLNEKLALSSQGETFFPVHAVRMVFNLCHGVLLFASLIT